MIYEIKTLSVSSQTFTFMSNGSSLLKSFFKQHFTEKRRVEKRLDCLKSNESLRGFSVKSKTLHMVTKTALCKWDDFETAKKNAVSLLNF